MVGCVGFLTRYGRPYILSTWAGPNAHDMAKREASMTHQQVVDSMTSPFSLGLNSGLLGRKWEPVLPGLRYSCICIISKHTNATTI